MASFIDMQSDFSEATRALSELGMSGRKAQKKVLAGVGTVVKKKIKKSYQGYGIRRQTGTLEKSIIRKVSRSGKEVVVYPNAYSEDRVRYPWVLARGGLIRTEGLFTFQINGKWVRKHTRFAQPRNYIAQPAEHYLASSDCRDQIDRILARQIKKIEEKKKI